MLTHLLVYFAFTALHLFSGVSAAAIGSISGHDSHNNVGSRTAVEKRDDGEQAEDQDQDDDDMPPDLDEIEDILPHATKEQMISLMADMPDDVLDQGSDAAEDWMREHLQSWQSIAARDADSDVEARWFKEIWQVATCAGGIGWLVAQSVGFVSKAAKLPKIIQLKKTIDDVGGYKKAAKMLMTKTKKKNKHRKQKSKTEKGRHRKQKSKTKNRTPAKKSTKKEKLESLVYAIMGANVMKSECPKVFD